MNIFRTFTLVAAVGIAAAWPVTAQQTETLSPEAWGAAGGIQVEVKVPKTVTVGEPVPARMTLTNVSGKDITVYQIDGYSEWSLQLVDGLRTPVPRTRYGQGLVQEKPNVRGRPFVRFITHVIKPGESRTVTRNLARLYDLSLSGYYAVSIQYDTEPVDGDEKAVVVKSGLATIKVEEPQ